MGFHQTEKHRSGIDSYRQIGLFRGQFGKVNRDEWLKFLEFNGFDGFEEASWELDLVRCDTEEGAETYARELVATAKKYGLEIFSLASHLQGQALGDEPSAKTLQFVGGEAMKIYSEWRKAGKVPPREDPYFVPPAVEKQIHEQARTDMVRIVRLAHFMGKEQDRQVVVSTFVGSPANCWSHFFGFPPLPMEIAGYKIPDVRQVSLELLIERFTPVFGACLEYGVKLAHECHPSERAMGDITSARELLDAVEEAGFDEILGFNFDASHMVWQGVSPIEFLREFAEYIFSVHLKGIQVVKGFTRNGLLGGHQDMGNPDNGWNFVTAGCDRDSVPEEEILVELKRIGFDGAVTIEWEDNDVEQLTGAELALKRLRKIDLPPSDIKHDEALKAIQ